jgi:dTDP-4-amino-4,6-dideoxygalactose transaminase
MAMIPFFRTTLTGNEGKYVTYALQNADVLASREFTVKCEKWFNEHHTIKNFFLTKSCTDSLELAALVLNIQPGDEVIMPSFAFVSCANAFALRGATCVFVDIHPQTMNIREDEIEKAITAKTKAIVTVNYASVACNYEAIKSVAAKHGLYVVEDNAHGIGAKQGGRFLGTFGDISTFSFDHLKNVTCIQGGGIAINNEALLERFYVAYEFGTNRRAFFKGNADRYEWKCLGSNFPLAELNAAMLYAQLEEIASINSSFTSSWGNYYERLMPLQNDKKIRLPEILSGAEHNGHCFYIKASNPEERSNLMLYLQRNGVAAQFHYTPLHTSAFGSKTARTLHQQQGTFETTCLLRLPLYYGLSETDLQKVTELIYKFYNNRNV